MKALAKSLVFFALVSLFALQSCERREPYVKILSHPLERGNLFECHFMAFPGLNSDDYIIDGELTGYKGGTKYLVANYKKGVLDGTFTEFYGNGQLYSKVNFSNGVKSGAYNKLLFINERFINPDNKPLSVEVVRDNRYITGNYKDNKMSGEWKILDKDSSAVAVFQFEDGYNVCLFGKWLSDSGITFEVLNDGTYNFKDDKGNSASGRYEFNDDLVLSFHTKSSSYYMITAYDSSTISMTGSRIGDSIFDPFAPQPDPNLYIWTRISN